VYVLNNPLSFIDPLGLNSVAAGCIDDVGSPTSDTPASSCEGGEDSGENKKDNKGGTHWDAEIGWLLALLHSIHYAPGGGGGGTPWAGDTLDMPGALPVDGSSGPGGRTGAAQKHPINLVRLGTIVFHETGSLTPNPWSWPDEPGSEEDLSNARVAVAEVIINRFRKGGVRIGKDVASDKFTAKERRAFKDKVPSVFDALGGSMVAAATAYRGSNFMQGAMQYRTRDNGDLTGNLGRTATNPGTPLLAHFGPFANYTLGPNGTGIVVIAP
jgi:hypothetical protein